MREAAAMTRAVAVRMMLHGALWTLAGTIGLIAAGAAGGGAPMIVFGGGALFVGVVDLGRGALRARGGPAGACGSDADRLRA